MNAKKIVIPKESHSFFVRVSNSLRRYPPPRIDSEISRARIQIEKETYLGQELKILSKNKDGSRHLVRAERKGTSKVAGRATAILLYIDVFGKQIVADTSKRSDYKLIELSQDRKVFNYLQENGYVLDDEKRLDIEQKEMEKKNPYK